MRQDLRPVGFKESCLQLVRLNLIESHYNFGKENEFIVSKFRSEIRKKCISVIGPDLWNSLQDSIKSLSLISVFKLRIVSSFINAY